MQKKVSVLITTYNSGSYLKEAIESVFHQTYKNWEIILVDDDSKDKSLEYINDLPKDSRIKVVKNQTNLGQSKSLNVGLGLVDSEFFMQLDADDWLPTDALEVLMNEAGKMTEDVALFTGNVIHVYETRKGKQIKELVRTITTEGRSFNERYDILLSNYTPYPRFYRTEAVKQLGGWSTDDPYEGRHIEDLRMFLRLIEQYKFHWFDHVLYYYRLHSHNNSTRDFPLINKVYEWIIKDALRRWGDEYIPVFEQRSNWILLSQLIRREN